GASTTCSASAGGDPVMRTRRSTSALVEDDVAGDRGKARRVDRAVRARVGAARDDVCVIPKASIPNHIRENAYALEFKLDDENMKLLDEELTRPSGPNPWICNDWGASCRPGSANDSDLSARARDDLGHTSIRLHGAGRADGAPTEPGLRRAAESPAVL